MSLESMSCIAEYARESIWTPDYLRLHKFKVFLVARPMMVNWFWHRRNTCQAWLFKTSKHYKAQISHWTNGDIAKLSVIVVFIVIELRLFEIDSRSWKKGSDPTSFTSCVSIIHVTAALIVSKYCHALASFQLVLLALQVFHSAYLLTDSRLACLLDLPTFD